MIAFPGRLGRLWPTAVVCLLLLGACATHKPGALNPPSPAAKPPEQPGPGTAVSPSPEDVENELDPDRPDVTNGTHIVPLALAQLELGGQYSRVTQGEEVGTPVALRVGLLEWLEGRIETDALSVSAPQAGGTEPAASQTSFGGLGVGAKLRMWGAPGWPPVIDLMPDVTLPVGGQPGTTFTLRVATGTDFGEHYHVDFNYGIGTIASDLGRFSQHLLSVSGTRELGPHASPYAEVYWYSKDQASGRPWLSSDVGLVYTLSDRYAVDGGVELGMTAAAPHPSVFGGMTVIVGEVKGHHGVHERLREAAVMRLATRGR